MDYLFTAESVGVSFRGVQVLKSASMWASQGMVTSLLGRNGSGKTTLFRASVGHVSRDFGTVHFQGQSHRKPRLPTLAQMGLFFLPPSGILSRRRPLRWHLAMIRERYRHEVRKDLPAELEADPLLDKSDWEMSGGEARRAEIALAWTRRPVCLLADEPLAGLAPMDQDRVAGVIRQMADEGCAVVISGHDARRLLDLSDQVIWLAAGTTHGLGTPDAARDHDQFRREYLGPGV